MIILFFLLLIFSTALLFGNEFSVGFLIHPSLSRTDHRGLLPAIQVFARYFGKIMPFWMTGTSVFHFLLLWITWKWPAHHTVCLLCAAILWVIIIVFSVSGPVPINNQVKAWDPVHLPDNWEAERRRWDALNAIRVVLIGLAFLALLLAFRSVPITR
jgi:hypothetical protein